MLSNETKQKESTYARTRKFKQVRARRYLHSDAKRLAHCHLEGNVIHYDYRTHFAMLQIAPSLNLLYIVDIHPESYFEVTKSMLGHPIPKSDCEAIIHEGSRWLIKLISLEQAMYFAKRDDMMFIEITSPKYGKRR